MAHSAPKSIVSYSARLCEFHIRATLNRNAIASREYRASVGVICDFPRHHPARDGVDNIANNPCMDFPLLFAHHALASRLFHNHHSIGQSDARLVVDNGTASIARFARWRGNAPIATSKVFVNYDSHSGTFPLVMRRDHSRRDWQSTYGAVRAAMQARLPR